MIYRDDTCCNRVFEVLHVKENGQPLYIRIGYTIENPGQAFQWFFQ
jgi:hypothetical protein